MKKLLVINACVRDSGSRTKRIGDALIDCLGATYETEEVNLTDGYFLPVDKESFAKRGRGIFEDGADMAAKKFAEADLILIMAPFWDMSFPASLKAYFERISLPDITFRDGEKETVGICKARSIIYCTTRGMNIPDGSIYEQATPYIRAYAHLCGIEHVDVVSAYNMDYVTDEEREAKLTEAIDKGIKICRNYLT